MDDAACRDCPDEDLQAAFGPEVDQYWFVAIYCSGCPVVADCFDYAERRNIRDGVYGAFTPRQRTQLNSKAI